MESPIKSIKSPPHSTEVSPTNADKSADSGILCEESHIKIQWPTSTEVIFEAIQEAKKQLPCIIEFNNKPEFSFEDYQHLGTDSRLLKYIEYNDKKKCIIVIEMPTDEHDAMAMAVSSYIRVNHPQLTQLGSANFTYVDQKFVQPDACFKLAGRAYTAKPFIIEVACSQSLSEAISKFKSSYFKNSDFRVGLIVDITNNVITMHRLVNEQIASQFNIEPHLKSKNGVIRIEKRLIYPPDYTFRGVNVEALSDVEINLRDIWFESMIEDYFANHQIN